MRQDKEQCPVCGNELYEVLDSDTDFQEEYIWTWWRCRCDTCHTDFTIEATYKLVTRTVEEVK